MKTKFATDSEYTTLKAFFRVMAVALLVLMASSLLSPVFAADGVALNPANWSLFGKTCLFVVVIIIAAFAMTNLRDDEYWQGPRDPSFGNDPWHCTDLPQTAPMEAIMPPIEHPANAMPVILEAKPFDWEETMDVGGVEMFALAMKQRLETARAVENRAGWWHQTTPLNELEGGLRRAMRKGNVVDIANYCMFLHQRGVERLGK